MRDQGNREGSTNTAMLLRGLDWLVGEKVRIINLSLGGPGDDLMASVFEKLRKRGLIVVAAAGNGGPAAQPSYPAAYRGVIAVTAVDALDRPYADANHGSYIALAAPGVDVWIPDKENGHYVTGTSFSAAVVSSAIGLMLSYRADLSPELVREHLCRSARDLGAAGHDPVYGCGLLQIGRALAGLKSANGMAEPANAAQ
jgi:subtilisin family serine protease